MNNNTQDGSKLTPEASLIRCMNQAYQKYEAVKYPAMPYTEDYSYASDWVMEGARKWHNQETSALQARVKELEEEISDHGPNGRNVTNQQHQEMRTSLQSRIAELEKENEQLNKFLDEATENHHKLMGLLEDYYLAERRLYHKQAGSTSPKAYKLANADWVEFCKEYKLKK